MTTPLILVSDRVQPAEHYQQGVDSDLIPRLDFMEIAYRLDGEICSYGVSNSAGYEFLLSVEKQLKVDFLQALCAVRRTGNHNSFLSVSEKTGIPLSILFSIIKKEFPHVLIAHHLSSKNKRRLFQVWPLYKSFSRLICVSRSQADFAKNQLGIHQSKVDFIFNGIDHKFFRPDEEDSEDFILAVGKEQRDYKTLARAVAETGLKLIVVASSPWSTFPVEFNGNHDIKIMKDLTFRELRSLYARARLVVVPLFEVDYAAGVNTVLEAMAMAKAVIITRTPGIRDHVLNAETGLFVSPENPEEMKEKILSLWENPNELARLGGNARQAVEQCFTLDIYVDHIVRIMQQYVNNS
jgi:glycosyltransferase involved in cell wall biosynthesis